MGIFALKNIIEIYRLLKNGYLGAYVGLYDTNVKQDKDPETCMYVRSARNKFFNSGEYKNIVEICRKIVEEYDDKSVESFIKEDE